MRRPLVEFEREVCDGVVLVVLEGEEFGVYGLEWFASAVVVGGAENVAELVMGVVDGDSSGVGKPCA